MEPKIRINREASDALKDLLSSLGMTADTLRVFISGMSCSGPMFNIAKDEQNDKDYSCEFDGIKYIADQPLIDQFGGFEIQFVKEEDFRGLYVKPDIMPNLGGCATCGGGCH